MELCTLLSREVLCPGGKSFLNASEVLQLWHHIACSQSDECTLQDIWAVWGPSSDQQIVGVGSLNPKETEKLKEALGGGRPFNFSQFSDICESESEVCRMLSKGALCPEGKGFLNSGERIRIWQLMGGELDGQRTLEDCCRVWVPCTEQVQPVVTPRPPVQPVVSQRPSPRPPGDVKTPAAASKVEARAADARATESREEAEALLQELQNSTVTKSASRQSLESVSTLGSTVTSDEEVPTGNGRLTGDTQVSKQSKIRRAKEDIKIQVGSRGTSPIPSPGGTPRESWSPPYGSPAPNTSRSAERLREEEVARRKAVAEEAVRKKAARKVERLKALEVEAAERKA